MQEDIRLILNRYNYLDSKLENLINKYKEQKRDIRAGHILLAKYSQKNEEQEKIIDLMAKSLEELEIAYLIKDGGEYRTMNKEELKDYYKKEARENNGYKRS